VKPDPHAAGLYPLHDPDWRAKLLHAGRLVWVPFVGWPMLLGYRRSLIGHIASGHPAAMPAWHGAHRTHLANGLKAMLVIQVYLAPVSLALIGLLHSRGYSPGPWAAGLAVLCVTFPLFASLAIPVVVVLATTGFVGERYLAPGEALLFLIAFAGVVFLLPAAFMRVATTGRYRHAFDLHRTLPFVARHLSAYLAAWWYGTWMNGIALIAFVVAPWTLFWGYVASAVLFSQLALEDDANEALPSDADLVRIVKTPWFSVPLPDVDPP
jgi:hypothetical protein